MMTMRSRLAPVLPPFVLFLLGVVSLLPQNSDAWYLPSPSFSSRTVTTRSGMRTSAATTTTHLSNGMFDWLNPSSTMDKEDTTTTTTNDFFASWFQVKAPPKDAPIRNKEDVVKAEAAIAEELASVYETASIPPHLYDESRVKDAPKELGSPVELFLQKRETLLPPLNMGDFDQRAKYMATVYPVAAPKKKQAKKKTVEPSPPPTRPTSFVEQAEDAIEKELSSLRMESAIPTHLYDETRIPKGYKPATSTAATSTTTPSAISHRPGVLEEAATDTAIRTGIVKWFDPNKGYGFVEPHDADMNPIFVHHSDIHCVEDVFYRKLLNHESVEFQVTYDKYGRSRATHVTGPHGTPVKAIMQQQLSGPADSRHHHRD
jgi:cold shock CspA family protein